MARKENLVPTTPLQVALNDALIEQLKLLVLTGKWGRTPSEAVERIVSSKIAELIQEAKDGVGAIDEFQRMLRGSGLYESTLHFEDLKAPVAMNPEKDESDAKP